MSVKKNLVCIENGLLIELDGGVLYTETVHEKQTLNGDHDVDIGELLSLVFYFFFVSLMGFFCQRFCLRGVILLLWCF